MFPEKHLREQQFHSFNFISKFRPFPWNSQFSSRKIINLAIIIVMHHERKAQGYLNIIEQSQSKIVQVLQLLHLKSQTTFVS